MVNINDMNSKSDEQRIVEACMKIDEALKSNSVTSLLGILHARIVSFAYVGADDPRITERIEMAIKKVNALSDQGVDISSCFVHLVSLARDNNSQEISRSSIKALLEYARGTSGQDANLQMLAKILNITNCKEFPEGLKTVLAVVSEKLGTSKDIGGTLSAGTIKPPNCTASQTRKPLQKY